MPTGCRQVWRSLLLAALGAQQRHRPDHFSCSWAPGREPDPCSLWVLPLPTSPDSFLLSDALEIDAADGPALRRVRRLFLGWSYYETPDGYADFGWWDLQGDGTATGTADAEADGEALSDAYDWFDDPAAGARDDNDDGDS